jgi:hypothetical protein
MLILKFIESDNCIFKVIKETTQGNNQFEVLGIVFLSYVFSRAVHLQMPLLPFSCFVNNQYHRIR